MVITPAASVVSGDSLWMTCPTLEDDTIPGLAYIVPLDQLIVAQKKDKLHNVIGKRGVPYTIFNSGGEKVFLAVLTKKFKEFHVRIFNNYGNEVINIKRPFSFCAKKVKVWAPPGQFVGSVRGVRKCARTYLVRDEVGKDVYNIHADGCLVYKVSVVPYCGRDVGELRAGCTVLNMNNFGVSFPRDADVKAKAVLLGACFLIGP